MVRWLLTSVVPSELGIHQESLDRPSREAVVVSACGDSEGRAKISWNLARREKERQLTGS